MTTTRVPVEELRALAERCLIAANTSEWNAQSVAKALVQADIDGQKGHGVVRVATYSAQSRTGKVDGHAKPKMTRTRPGSLMIDVANGFAFRAFELATEELPKLAHETGIAAAGFVRSHHAGALGQAVERLADAGMMAMMFANTPHAMTAWGGKRGVFGTNPIAFAAPRANGAPIIIDLALSQVVRGKILSAAQRGEPIPEGWANDAEGRPTTDAKAALKGTVLPIGGPKGAALALMVEILAGSLTGANQAFEATSLFDGEGNPPGIGQFLIAIDPGAFGGPAAAQKIELLASTIEADTGTRLPGASRRETREAAARDGVSIEDGLLASLNEMAQQTA
ncbi:(2R)-3-sulfolactate dehydrogenase (NADP(+)) [Candidatus Filomicrobium marinum]|uniref:(2R)-3-sulfolactate dehydrogenase (NADP(+)) n=1 Tax=Candidatus Filomicrobium marinum TaxID=1608628 RepID=A0A0D6JFR0_9HYPH|nr:Ldh family oxidoreductase [Candidatus Filomicrobium marinum]CFX21794.1 (2R)-3-sulfolactate dehydrogenase (NADP(+)) [Candidatus Filomicrobium marinum]CPR18823.1 (2R)-3-sulfolactate dehydrogenase (NADP(+)) [Candidatus Filomicrobium marinum]